MRDRPLWTDLAAERSATPRRKTCSRFTTGSAGSRGRYLLAAAFGNVHGVYKPGQVKLKPAILKAEQAVNELKGVGTTLFGSEGRFYKQ